MSADFSIYIDFKKDSEDPSRVFRAMTGLIETCELVDSFKIFGFPDYCPGNEPSTLEAKVTSIRTVSGQRRIIVDHTILGGYSGGPVLNNRNKVIGIAAKGRGVSENEIIQINDLERLLEK